MSQWEGMRSQLFGSGGATVSGLFNGAAGKGRPGARGKRQPSDRKGAGRSFDGGWNGRAGLRSPVLGCVAESLAPARSTQEMSDFMSRMQR